MPWTFLNQASGTNIAGLPVIGSAVSPSLDQFIIYDDSAAANRKVSVSQLLADSIVFPVEVPVSAVLPFAKNSVPPGWLAANGAAVSRSVYSALFFEIGTLYGTGDGSTTFNLPDLRGYFVRGAGVNGDGTAAGDFGVRQADGIRDHNHRWRYANTSLQAGASVIPIVQGAGGLAYDIGMVPGTAATETRPKNVPMLFCIKF